MREVVRGPYGNAGHGGERFWRKAAVLQQPWGSGAKLGTTDGRELVKGEGERERDGMGWDV